MMMKKVGSQLNTIGQQYQVDPATLVAIFGIETNYGRQIGKTNVLNAWLTRACTENKPLWEKNAYASVRLLRDGVVPADNFVGSWSGAFGMTQFIPTSFYELAADGDGDGRIDLYNSLPDALASTANHLRKRRAKWTMGCRPWWRCAARRPVRHHPAGAGRRIRGLEERRTIAHGPRPA